MLKSVPRRSRILLRSVRHFDTDNFEIWPYDLPMENVHICLAERIHGEESVCLIHAARIMGGEGGLGKNHE